MSAQESRSGNSFFLFDSEIIAQVDDRFFDQNMTEETVTATGRGEAIFFSIDGDDFVLRHYRRGGIPSLFLEDRYLGTNINKTRAWREWQLLDELYCSGFPVPQPIAARVIKQGVFYRADLVTRRLQAEPLAERLLREPIDSVLWFQLGEMISRFHKRGVFHADLNARNIMLGSDSHFYLIDFDRGEIRYSARGWQQANLARLHRSFDKFKGNNSEFYFSEGDWQQLLSGYRID